MSFLRKQQSSFVECLEILDSRLRGNDTMDCRLRGSDTLPHGCTFPGRKPLVLAIPARGSSPGPQGVILAQAGIQFSVSFLRKQQSSFVECLEILDSRLRGSDTIEALSGENQWGPPFG